MRESVPTPAESRYATLSLTPSTSRNCSGAKGGWSCLAPGTTRDRQCAPPSVVRAKVPPTPLAQTTLALTGLTACNRLSVPLCCGVSVGAAARCSSELADVEPLLLADSSPAQPGIAAMAAANKAAETSRRSCMIASLLEFVDFPGNARTLRRARRLRQGGDLRA